MDNAKLIIYNSDWEKIGIIDAYTSLIWTKRYTTYGDFELYLPFSKQYLNILKSNNYVCIDGTEIPTGKYAMIVEHVEITQSAEDNIMLVVKGRSLASILYRRVLYSDVFSISTDFGFICDLINSCFNEIPPRKLGNGFKKSYDIYDLTHKNTKGIRVANKGENLGETIEKFCNIKGIGFDVLYDDRMYNIHIYKFESKEDTVIFSSELDNLANCTYTEDVSDFANVARMEYNQSVLTVPTTEDTTVATCTGINRYEKIFTMESVGEGVDIIKSLRSKGVRELGKHSVTKEIAAEIISTKTYTYDKDYMVGDVVKIVTDFGITAVAQLIEMTESWSDEGYRLMPTFANYKIIPDEDDE